MADTDTKAAKASQGASTRAAAKQAAATAATASGITPGSADDSVSDEGTSPRSSGRRRSLSFLAHEALTNKWSEEEFETALARSRQVFKGGRAAAPSTTPIAVSSHTAVLSSSSSQSSSSAPPRAVGARTNNDDPLHGLNAALALATNRETKVSGSNDIAAEPPSSRRGHGHANPIPPRMVAEASIKGCNSNSDAYHPPRHRRERHRHSRHRSRSRSSSSSPDQYTRDKHSLYYKGQRIRASDQWYLSSAAHVFADYWSFSDWYGNNKLRVKRNAFEAEELCAIIDEISWGNQWAQHGDMDEAAHHYALALEIASRRLEGVVRADESGHWEHANALSLLKRTQLGNSKLIRDLNGDISRARAAGNVTSSSSSSSYVPRQQPTVWRGGNRNNRGHHGGGRGGGRGNTNNGKGGNGKAADKSSSSDNTATK